MLWCHITETAATFRLCSSSCNLPKFHNSPYKLRYIPKYNQSKFFLEICEPKLHTNIKTTGELLFILPGLRLFPKSFQVFMSPSLQNFFSLKINITHTD